MTPPQEPAKRPYKSAILGSLVFVVACLAIGIKTVRNLYAPTASPVASLSVNDQLECYSSQASSESGCLETATSAPTQKSTGASSSSRFEQAQLLAAKSSATSLELPQPAPWPEIHEHARLAKVPIVMYHDILPQKEVFFDVTPQELEADFALIQSEGLTPISMDLLVNHLRTGTPLPEKPILLTFDDGYGGHYQYVYPLLKQYGYPAVFSIYTKKMELKGGRTSVTWEQLQEMAADPLVTIVSHSITHPDDLRNLSDQELEREVVESKRLLEERLKIPIHYFTYPVGRSDERVEAVVANAGYKAALSMDDLDEQFAGESENLLTIARFGQSRLEQIASEAWGGHPLPRTDGGFNFTTSVRQQEHTVDRVRVILITGGRPTTIHADSRYQVPEILEGTEAIAAVDGGFFSLKYLDSNVMIGPVLSHNTGQFIPGNSGENPKLTGRPLVLIGADEVQFIPFDPDRHNTLVGVMSEMETVTDAFVGAAWLVKDNQPQPRESFGSLFDFDAVRHRAFWGINQAGQPVVGVSRDMVDSIRLGKILQQLGLRDAVMLDSGASTSLTLEGESLVGYVPRPVPHVVALFPPLTSPTKIIESLLEEDLEPWFNSSQTAASEDKE